MTTIKKIVAFPAYLSSLAYATIRPDRVEWWDRKFNLDQMDSEGYIFGATVWIVFPLLLVAVFT